MYHDLGHFAIYFVVAYINNQVIPDLQGYANDASNRAYRSAINKLNDISNGIVDLVRRRVEELNSSIDNVSSYMN